MSPPIESRSRDFDWQGGYARLAKARAAIEAVDDPPPEVVAKILRRRAVAIAAPTSAAEAVVFTHLVGFGFRDRLFAVEVDQLTAIVDIAGMTEAPGLPPVYLGLINYRGDVYPVIDINPLLGSAPSDASQPTRAILVVHKDQAIAIAADHLFGLSPVDVSTIVLSEQKGAPHPATRGFLPSGAIVFDAHQLLFDTRLCVDDEPEAPNRNGGPS